VGFVDEDQTTGIMIRLVVEPVLPAVQDNRKWLRGQDWFSACSNRKLRAKRD